MRSEVDAALAQMAEQQFGVFSRTQALDAGATRRIIESRCTAGRWVRVQPCVYRMGGAPASWHGDLLAACLSTGGTASHRSAAYLWHLDGSWRQQPEITVPRGRKPTLHGVIVHQSKDFDRRDECLRAGIPTTGLLRSVLDLGAVLPVQRVAQTVDHVLRSDQASLEDLWQVHTRHRRRGRNGTGVLASVLDAETRTRAIPDSFFERLVYDLIVDSGLPTPVLQHEVRDRGGRFVARLDLAYPDHRIGIELLGKQFHHTERAFERDPVRRNRLEVLGWTVLEFTWRGYVDRPNRLCIEVADALRRSQSIQEGR